MYRTFDYLNTRLQSYSRVGNIFAHRAIADTELHCDASLTSFGAVLFHRQTDNKTKLVLYYSQLTSPNKVKFHCFELEYLAIAYAIERFHTNVSNISFKVISDD